MSSVYFDDVIGIVSCRMEDIADCQWSGGFTLDKDYAFHVNMRYPSIYAYLHTLNLEP